MQNTFIVRFAKLPSLHPFISLHFFYTFIVYLFIPTPYTKLINFERKNYHVGNNS